jgi:hypothetical protein
LDAGLTVLHKKKIYCSKTQRNMPEGLEETTLEMWRERSNLEIQNMGKLPDIVTEFKVRRLEWLKHVIRVEETCLPEMVFNAEPEGRNGVCRPRLRWLDDVQVDIKVTGIKRWIIKAQDRKERSEILREAKAKRKGP